MRHTLLFLLSAVSSFANVLTYDTSVVLSGEPTYRQFTVAGNLTVPGFDSALGTLDSIDFSVSLGGGLALQTISQDAAHSLWFGSDISTVYSFLGISATHIEGDVFTRSNSYGACGPAYQTVCSLPVITNGLTDGSFGLFGSFSGESSSITRYWTGASTPMAGTLPANLTPYISSSQLVLPVSAAITVQPTGYSGLVIGGLMSPRTVFGLNWTYNYTPSPSVDPINSLVVHNPEPRYGVALLMLTLALAYRLRKI